MSHQTPQADWEMITPSKASAYLDRNEKNRKIGDVNVKQLARDMKDGNYLITGDTIKIDRSGRLIDGQHRLSAIVLSGVAQQMLVVRELDPMVQTVIDAQKRRSAADALTFALDASNGTALASIARIDMTIRMTRNPTATSYAKVASPTNTQVVEWVAENPDVMDAATRAKTLANKTRQSVDRIYLPASYGGWLWLQFGRAAGLETADEFFAPMMDRHHPFGSDDIEPRFDPRFVFMQSANKMTLGDRATLKPIVFGVRAWNTWRRGKELRTLREFSGGPRGSKIPMALEIVR